jgi:Domain of unknown function (DUF4434)
MLAPFLYGACLAVAASDDAVPYLSGAFIQLNDCNKNWAAQSWHEVLRRMRRARLDIVIIQYLESIDANGMPSGSFVPRAEGEHDPVAVIMDYADGAGMSVFLGLRYDARLLGSQFLNTPAALRAALAEELPQDLHLARELAHRYHLQGRNSFGGWYLPTEIANFSVQSGVAPGDDWITQLNGFTAALSRACRSLVPRPVAVAPYFNGHTKGSDYLVDCAGMQGILIGVLQCSDVSIVMLQDGVDLRHPIGRSRLLRRALPGSHRPRLSAAFQPGAQCRALARCRELHHDRRPARAG